MHSGLLSSLENVFLRGTQPPVQDVVVDGVIEQRQVLQSKCSDCEDCRPEQTCCIGGRGLALPSTGTLDGPDTSEATVLICWIGASSGRNQVQKSANARRV